MPCDLLVRGEPYSSLALHVTNESIEQRDARSMADDVRVHRQLEEPAFGIGRVELAPEDVEHALGRRVGPQRWKRFILK